MDSAHRVIPPPAPLTALCAWLVPGGGYWLLGQRARGTIIAITVLLVFAAGILIGGVRVVQAPNGFGYSALLDKPWFIGQVLTGPVSIAAAIGANHVNPLRTSVSRSWELGTLYTAVAGMLNLLALIDATHRAMLAGDGAGGEAQA